MESILEIISKFPTITLDQMDKVKLMDRTDTKYVFGVEKLGGLLSDLREFFQVLDVDGNLVSDYETLYFDTDEFTFFNDHQHGRGNRYKVRYRVYNSNGLSYFEVKFKTNKGRTIKERVKISGGNIFENQKATDLLVKHPKIANLNIFPKIWVNYSRITLVHNTLPIRMTIDIKLYFKHGETRIDLNEIAILELKREKSKGGGIENILASHGIHKSKFSKYCHGIMEIYPGIKINNFKERLRIIKKFKHENN